MAWLIAICIALAITASLLLVPVVRSLAHSLGIVDRPDSERKLHREPVALGGGLAVFLAMIFAFVGTILIDRSFFERSLGDISSNWYTLFAAAALMLLVGLIDDSWSLRGRQKLLLQCLILVWLVSSGTVIEKVSLLGYSLELGVFAKPLTIVWLLVAVNALNLIDGADGMATTAGSIICLGLGFLSAHTGAGFTAVVGFALAGSLAGFLVFNRAPASIYLGDAGSMTIGLFVGVLAVWSNFKETTVLASAPIAVLALPLFDSTAAIVRRWLTGRSIYTTDRAHVHHLLQEKYGNQRMLLLVAGLCATTTALSYMSLRLEQPWLAALGVVILLGLLVLTRSFGHAELRLLLGRAAHFAHSFAISPADGLALHHRRVSLQGVGDWDAIWKPVVEFAKVHDVVRVKIDLNLVWLHEGYHANWQSRRLPEKDLQLNVSVPLFAFRSTGGHRVPIGRLEIIAPANDPTVYDRVSRFIDRLIDLEPEIDRIIGSLEAEKQLSSVAGDAIAVPDREEETVGTPVSSEPV